MPVPDLSVILLHENMHNKNGELVTTSLTLLDVHDIARSAKTYGLTHAFIAHPSETLRKLTLTLQQHWEEGYGAQYNPNRGEALHSLCVVSNLEEAISKIVCRTSKFPRLIASSAKEGPGRVSYTDLRKHIHQREDPFLLMLGTGWGLSQAYLSRADYFLEPLKGPGEYNHLSVRSACAIMLDRLMGQ